MNIPAGTKVRVMRACVLVFTSDGDVCMLHEDGAYKASDLDQQDLERGVKNGDLRLICPATLERRMTNPKELQWPEGATHYGNGVFWKRNSSISPPDWVFYDPLLGDWNYPIDDPRVCADYCERPESEVTE